MNQPAERTPVVHPSLPHPFDAAYHDIINELSFFDWKTITGMAMDTKHPLKEVKRAIRLIDREHDLEIERNDSGEKVYRYGGCAR